MKNRFSENPAWRKWVIFTSAWGRVLLRGISSNNLNTKNLKLLQPWGIYRFEKKSKKYSGEINPLIVPLGVTLLEVAESSMQILSAFVLFSADKKIAFKSSWHILLSLYYWILLIYLAAIQNWEKIYTKTVVGVSKGTGERVFLFFWERLKGGFVGNYYF